MDFIEFNTGKDDLNRRADKVIKKIMKTQNLSGIYKAMRKGLIKINNLKVKPEQLILENDVIKIAAFLLEKDENQTENKPTLPVPQIVLQTEDVIFFNKPNGILVQKASKSDLSLDDCVKEFYKSINQSESLSFAPGPLHRLDKNTTGLIAFSWSLQGARWFSENIQTHSIKKMYLGIVEGKLEKTEIWQDTISKNFKKENCFQTVDITSSQETNAYTTATPLKYGKYNNQIITLVSFDIKTGKTHQIRSQSAFHGFPLLGDTAYGAKKQKLSREYFLHAHTLLIPEQNPLNLPSKIECPLLPDMEDFITKTCE